MLMEKMKFLLERNYQIVGNMEQKGENSNNNAEKKSKRQNKQQLKQ